jgi:trigger factor
VKTTLEPLEGNKVKLSVEVEEAEFEDALDDAFKRLAREVRIPGFRQGKAPRPVLEARLGPLVARDEAFRTALPDYYERAVREHEVDVIAPPDIDITGGQESGAVSFDAVVEVRPVITVEGYESLKVTIESPRPTDEEIEAQIDQLRTRFATYEPADRPAADGDHVTIDITGSQAGEALDGLTAEDYDYEVGAGAVVPELDEELRGAKAGDILEFDAAHPDEEEAPLHFRILVKEVQARVLPEVDDDFAQMASEHETVEAFRAELERSMGIIKTTRAQMALREATANALAELVEVELPEALVTAEVQDQLQNMALRASSQGLTLDQMLMLSGKTPDTFADELRAAAEISAKVDLALRALAEAEGIEATDEKIDEEFAEAAGRMGRDGAEMRAEFERGGQITAVRSDLRKRAALEWLLDRVEIVDDDGNPIDRAELELPEEPDTEDDELDASDTTDAVETPASDETEDDGDSE